MFIFNSRGEFKFFFGSGSADPVLNTDLDPVLNTDPDPDPVYPKRPDPTGSGSKSGSATLIISSIIISAFPSENYSKHLNFKKRDPIHALSLC